MVSSRVALVIRTSPGFGQATAAGLSAYGFRERWFNRKCIYTERSLSWPLSLLIRPYKHSRRSNFILLLTIVLDAQVTVYDKPLDYNPCLECKLCVAACPVGAIGSDGHFNFSACYTHNYREFMGGFTDWVGQVVESKDAADYRSKVLPGETASMWQSLSFGANYKAAYCMAVCPAGEDVIGPFLTDRKTFLAEVVKPLQQKEESVYVVPGSDAEAHVAKRFPHKTIRRVGNGLVPRSIGGFFPFRPLTTRSPWCRSPLTVNVIL